MGRSAMGFGGSGMVVVGSIVGSFTGSSCGTVLVSGGATASGSVACSAMAAATGSGGSLSIGVSMTHDAKMTERKIAAIAR